MNRRLFLKMLGMAVAVSQIPIAVRGASLIGSGIVAAGGTTCSGTYGETVDGSTNSNAAGLTWIQRTPFDCTAAAGDTTFNLRISDASTDALEVIMLIYADNEGEPGDLIWQSSQGDGISWDSTWLASQWITNIVNEALSGTHLWIGFHFESGTTQYHYTSNAPARTTRTIINAGTFPDIDNTWDTVNDDDTTIYGIACYLSY